MRKEIRQETYSGLKPGHRNTTCRIPDSSYVVPNIEVEKSKKIISYKVRLLTSVFSDTEGRLFS